MVSAWTQRLFSIAGMALLLCSTRCSSEKPDGEACEEDGDCTSTKCRNGTCEGADCACEGADCRGQSSCQAGWLCVRPSSPKEEVIPICRKQCTGPGTCQAGKRCENGLCRDGGEPFALEWVSFPRKSRCSAGVPCKYQVKAPPTVTVVKYSWTFGTNPPVDTTVPETAFTYTAPGTYRVTVDATSSDGATATQTADETLCLPQGAKCDIGGAPCCSGQCTIKNECPL